MVVLVVLAVCAVAALVCLAGALVAGNAALDRILELVLRSWHRLTELLDHPHTRA